MKTTAIRRIQSFVKRENRFTSAQAESLIKNWPKYGLEYESGSLFPDQIFNQQAPLCLEIGFGMGASFFDTIAKNPDINYIGIEVHRPGVGSFLNQVSEKELSNVRVYCHDAVEVLRDCIADHSLDAICIFFPDPWPKKRHHKRRLIQSDFIFLVEKKLKSGGILHLATDWEDYAQHMLRVLKASSLQNTSETQDFVPRPLSRSLTKYESRGQRLGHIVRDLIFIKN